MKLSTEPFVIDCSVTMAWCFNDEATEYTEMILDTIVKTHARTPAIWPLEVSNVLLIAERKKRLTTLQSTQFKSNLMNLPITVDSTPILNSLDTVTELARETNLTSYDAAYLELAMREDLAICSLDKSMLNAAEQLKIHTF